MKIKHLIMPLIALNLIGLASCQPAETKFKISFGSLVDETYTNLTYGELYQKVNYKENMVIATYPGKDTTCSCWRTFEYVLNDYVKAKDAIVYAIDAYEVIGKYNDFGLTLSTSDPSIAFFKNGKLVKQVVYSVVNTPRFFKNTQTFIEFMDENIIQPDLLYVDYNKIETARNNKEDFIIAHTYSDCSDCSYVVPNVLMPYTVENNLNKKVWIIDLNDIHSDSEVWTKYKDDNFLSSKNSEIYGYGLGYVPTFQYYKNGNLSSSSVFFNDTIEKINDKYVITNSFYTEERKNNLPYISNVRDNVLVGLEIPEEDIINYEEYNYIAWSQDAARKYHEPLLKAFLDSYTK